MTDGSSISPRASAMIEPAEADLTMSEVVREQIRDGVPRNTRIAYTRQWSEFTAWCAAQGRTSLPATGQTLAEYVGALRANTLSPATIEQAVTAIRTHHRLAGYPKFPDAERARLVLRSYKRELAEQGKGGHRQSTPVVIDSLRAMIDTCDLTTSIGVRNRLLLVLGLALMGRRSELIALGFDDVAETNEGLEVRIRTSKTDKDSRGEVVALPRGTHPLTDPVACWRDWLAILAAEGITSGRLLRSIDRHGNIGASLGGKAVNDIVRQLAKDAGVPGADAYTAHSLRAGGATVAYAAGAPVSVIAKHGRWAQNSPVVLGYIRAVDRWKDNAMRNVGL